jgi:hypothetical protein
VIAVVGSLATAPVCVGVPLEVHDPVVLTVVVILRMAFTPATLQ